FQHGYVIGRESLVHSVASHECQNQEDCRHAQQRQRQEVGDSAAMALDNRATGASGSFGAGVSQIAEDESRTSQQDGDDQRRSRYGGINGGHCAPSIAPHRQFIVDSPSLWLLSYPASFSRLLYLLDVLSFLPRPVGCSHAFCRQRECRVIRARLCCSTVDSCTSCARS